MAGGALVGSIGGAVDRGMGLDHKRRLVTAIAVLVVLFVLQQLSGPCLRALADALGRRAASASVASM